MRAGEDVKRLHLVGMATLSVLVAALASTGTRKELRPPEPGG